MAGSAVGSVAVVGAVVARVGCGVIGGHLGGHLGGHRSGGMANGGVDIFDEAAFFGKVKFGAALVFHREYLDLLATGGPSLGELIAYISWNTINLVVQVHVAARFAMHILVAVVGVVDAPAPEKALHLVEGDDGAVGSVAIGGVGPPGSSLTETVVDPVDDLAGTGK